MRKTPDLTNKQFNRLTVIKRVESYKVNGIYWECLCSCGNSSIVSSYSLLHDKVKSCGCWRKESATIRGKKKVKNLVGKRFGRLVVEQFEGIHNHRAQWSVRCDCGKTNIVLSGALLSGNTKSCGCLGNESRIKVCKSRLQNLTGKVFGKWTVGSLAGFNKHGSSLWHVKCACGNEKITSSNNLRSGNSQSCGCSRYNHFISLSELDFGKVVKEVFGIELINSFLIENRVFDYKIPNKNILIELDSSYWHSSEADRKNDQYKNELAKNNGYILFRFRLDRIRDVRPLIEKEHEQIVEILHY
jgi:hypothetical protein